MSPQILLLPTSTKGIFEESIVNTAPHRDSFNIDYAGMSTKFSVEMHWIQLTKKVGRGKVFQNKLFRVFISEFVFLNL